MTIKEPSDERRQTMPQLLAHRVQTYHILWRWTSMMSMSGTQRRVSTHPQLPVAGRGISAICLMAKGQKWHANVASPGWILDSNRKGTPAPFTRHTRKNNPAPTLPMSVNPIRNHLRAAFKEQTSIKWMNIHKGRLSHKWQQFSTHHVRSKKINLRAQEWGPKFVTAMWDHSLRIWKFHNDAFHADTNAQVKSYKLKNSIGRKYDAEPDMQNFNHYYTFSNWNISNPRLRSTSFVTTVNNVGQISPNSFLTKLNPDFHPHTMNYYHSTWQYELE
jgi:hypothetical protein